MSLCTRKPITKRYKKDKRITKLYKKFKELSKDLYNLANEKKHSGVCLNAKDMSEKYMSDNLENAKYRACDMLSFLAKVEEENSNMALFY